MFAADTVLRSRVESLPVPCLVCHFFVLLLLWGCLTESTYGETRAKHEDKEDNWQGQVTDFCLVLSLSCLPL